MDVLLDSSGLVAAVRRGDVDHVQARAFFRTPRLHLATTSAVLGEAYTYLRARDGYGVALNAVEGVRASGVATIEFIDRDFDRRIWDTIREFAGVPLSYVDASLVVLGQRLRLRRVFSFDDDLRQAGLELVP